MLKRRLHRLVWVYTCKNAALLEITCHGSNVLYVKLRSYDMYMWHLSIYSNRWKQNFRSNIRQSGKSWTSTKRLSGISHQKETVCLQREASSHLTESRGCLYKVIGHLLGIINHRHIENRDHLWEIGGHQLIVGDLQKEILLTLYEVRFQQKYFLLLEVKGHQKGHAIGGQGQLMGPWKDKVCGIANFSIAVVVIRAPDFFFQDWWAKVTHGAKNGGSFSEMMGPSILN